MSIKSQLSHYQQKQLSQIKYLNDAADASLNRSKSLALRKTILDSQKVKNYQSEYDRIRNHVENSATPFRNQASLKNRTDHLKRLGARAIDTIQ